MSHQRKEVDFNVSELITVNIYREITAYRRLHRFFLIVAVISMPFFLPKLLAQRISTPLPDNKISEYPFNMVGKVFSPSIITAEATGVAISEKVVLTSAHLFYDEGNLKFASGSYRWRLQHSLANIFEAPVGAQSYRIFSDYAKATRLFDPGRRSSSFEQVNLDAICLIFFEDVANGGHTAWGSNLITESSEKMIIGYPSLGYSSTDPRRHTMHSTSLYGSLANFKLVNYNDRLDNSRRLYKTDDLFTGPGNSGGPVYGHITFPDGTNDWGVIGIVASEIPDEYLFVVGIDDAVSLLIKSAESDTQLPTSDDHGDSRETATVVALNSAIPGIIETASDLDYFRIEVEHPGTLSVFTSGNTDTVGILQNALGNIIFIDDESGSGSKRTGTLANFTPGNTDAIEIIDDSFILQNELGNKVAIVNESSSGSNFLMSVDLDPGTCYLMVSHYKENGLGPYTLSVEFTEPNSLPDLAVSSINVASTSVISGEKVLVDFFRSNSGLGPAVEYEHGLYLSVDENITTKDTNLGNFTESGLLSGISEGNFFEVIIPMNLNPDTYYLGYIVDPFERIKESDENNNAGFTEIIVTDIEIDENDQPQGKDNILIKGWGNVVGEAIRHPNGNFYNQVLLTGPFAVMRSVENEIIRAAFIDETDDIVQVEFSGNAVVTITLDAITQPLPAYPEKYNQNVLYVKGRPRITVEEADENTFLSVYTVGPTNAVNKALFPEGKVYDAMADVSLIEIKNSTGFGGIQSANTRFTGSTGKVGIDANGVPVAVRALVGEIDASDEAVPYLRFGENSFTVEAPNAGLRIIGGDLVQSNNAPIIIAPSGSETPGFETLISQDNIKSDGTLQPRQNISGEVSFSNANGWKINVIVEAVTLE